MDFKTRIFSIIQSAKGGAITFGEIAERLQLHDKDRRKLKTALDSLSSEGEIIDIPRRGYISAEKANKFPAKVRGNERGFAFVTREGGGDYYVSEKLVHGAQDGDDVLAAHIEGTADQAVILKILRRAHEQVVGTVEFRRGRVTVYPDNLKLPPVAVPATLAMGNSGDKVLCQITSFKNPKLSTGKIVEVLGESGDLEGEELSIIRDFGLEEEFPDEVIAEAEKVSRERVILNGRADFRDKIIITIDGADTRDIDDGVSLERDGENYVLGVHIADVSNYVRPATALDKNAYARGTSVYFPDRVLPMLPTALSNGACSLNESEDRYALSCLMTFAPDGERLSYKIYESVINSAHRTTYDEITALLKKDPDICLKYRDILKIAEDMESLCLALEKRRDRRGAVNLEVKEAHIFVDEKGEIVIPTAERNIAQRIIEQFMISANEAVAEFLLGRGGACLYRVHEKPSPEKVERLANLARLLGEKADFDTEEVAPADFQRLLKEVEGKPYYDVLNKIMLRTMQKARYAEKNLGHFGLASDCYCHFTSPIRRYPDLFVHRSIKDILHGGKGKKYADLAKSYGVHLSEREKIAEDCERKVDDLYALAYMSERIGEQFDAVVSGVTAHNIYCELDNAIEGVIPIEDLPADDYNFDEAAFALKGRKHVYRLGDKVRIEVRDYDLSILKTLFILVN